MRSPMKALSVETQYSKLAAQLLSNVLILIEYPNCHFPYKLDMIVSAIYIYMCVYNIYTYIMRWRSFLFHG